MSELFQVLYHCLHARIFAEINLESSLFIRESYRQLRSGYNCYILTIISQNNNIISTLFELDIYSLIERTDDGVTYHSDYYARIHDELIAEYDLRRIVVSLEEPSSDKIRNPRSHDHEWDILSDEIIEELANTFSRSKVSIIDNNLIYHLLCESILHK